MSRPSRFLVLHATTAPLVLGRPWLDKQDPHVSWSTGRILGWSLACHANCLRSASSPPSGAKPSPSPPVLTGIPPAYHDLAPVFCKKKVHFHFPPHTVRTIAPLTSSRGPLLPSGSYTTSPSPRRRQCAITSRSPWPQASYGRPPPLLPRVSSLWLRRTAA